MKLEELSTVKPYMAEDFMSPEHIKSILDQNQLNEDGTSNLVEMSDDDFDVMIERLREKGVNGAK